VAFCIEFFQRRILVKVTNANVCTSSDAHRCQIKISDVGSVVQQRFAVVVSLRVYISARSKQQENSVIR